MRQLLSIGLMIVAVTVAACGGSGGGEQTTSEPPSSRATATMVTRAGFPPPKQRNVNYPDVVIDGCAVGDGQVRRAGFEPATRKRADFLGGYTFLGCEFEDGGAIPELALDVLMSNIGMAEYREKHRGKYVDVRVNGRDAARVDSPGGARGLCEVAIADPTGLLRVAITLGSPKKPIHPCDPLQRAAEAVEPILNGKFE